MGRIRSRVEASLAGRSVAEVAIVFPLWLGASWFAWLLVAAPALEFLPRMGQAIFVASLALWLSVNVWLFCVIVAFGRRHRMSLSGGPIRVLQITLLVFLVPHLFVSGGEEARDLLPQILLGLECLILGFTLLYLLLGSAMKNPPPRREWLAAAGMLAIVALSLAHRSSP